MKVLEKGTGFSRQVRCTGKGVQTGAGCKALLEFSKEDIFIVYGGDYTESIPYCAIRCPECGVDTCLEDMGIDIPSSVKKEALDRREWARKHPNHTSAKS